MLEELAVPLILLLLLIPIGIALFGFGWALRSYRARYELDNALADARRREARAAGDGPGPAAREIAAPTGSGEAPKQKKASPSKAKGDIAVAAKRSEDAVKRAAEKLRGSSAIAKPSTNSDYTSAQQEVLDRAAQQAEKFTSGEVEPDDLMQIKGVANVLNGKLNGFGIYSYEQIATWRKEDIEAFGELLAFKDRIGRDDWVGQTKILYKEKYGKTIG